MRPRKKLRLAVAALLIAGALGYILAEGLGSSLQYFQTAAQAVKDRAQLGGQDFNIEGAVVPGSIRRNGATLNFAISSGKTQVAVMSRSMPSQLFKAGMPVVLTGHFVNGTPPDPVDPSGVAASSYYFLSSQIMVKHSAQYIAAHPNRVKSPYSSTAAP